MIQSRSADMIETQDSSNNLQDIIDEKDPFANDFMIKYF